MREYLKKLPKEIQDLIHLVGKLAMRKNMSAYLVGGFVRDLLLGAKNFDLDIVIEGDGISFARALAVSLKSKLITHKRFRTATIIVRPDLKIDIATARKEFYPQPAHLPVVEVSNLRDDHFRRDFTINAMAISITGKNFGELIDFFNGKNDLENKRVRILHNLSFVDDPTRILRAIRFEKRLNFTIEPKTLRLLKQAVKFKMLDKLNPQRIGGELISILKEEYPIRQIKRIQNLIGFDFLSKQLSVNKKIYALLRSIEKMAGCFVKFQSPYRKIDPWLMYFMGLIDPLNKNEAKTVCRKFTFSKDVTKRIMSYKKINREFVLGLDKAKLKPSKICALLHPLAYEVILTLKAKYKNINIQQNIDGFLKIYSDIRISSTGEDLKELGIKPGPQYQQIFKNILEAKLDGIVSSKCDELKLIRKISRIG